MLGLLNSGCDDDDDVLSPEYFFPQLCAGKFPSVDGTRKRIEGWIAIITYKDDVRDYKRNIKIRNGLGTTQWHPLSDYFAKKSKLVSVM
jgi:hypothetical protein